MNPKVENRGDVLLKKWLDGTITWQEERELEQLAQGDAMLTDALAGFRAMPEGSHTASVERIKAHLQKRRHKRQGFIFYLPRVAAAAAIVGTLTVGVWFFSKDVGHQQPSSVITSADKSAIENETPSIAAVPESVDSNEALALDNQETSSPVIIKRHSVVTKPTKPATDGTRVETDTALAIAQSETLATESASKPELALKKAEAAPPAPQMFDRAQSQNPATTRAFTPSPAGRVITGKVTDEHGEPVIGASVVVEGTNQGTVSDMEGNFKIELPKGKEALTISYTGYDAKEVRLGASDTVNLQLQPGGMALSEVTVSEQGADKKQKIPAIKRGDENTDASKPEIRMRSETSISRSQPQPRGGLEKFKRYIEKNLRYPKAAREAGIEGEVAVAFIILPNGKLTDFKIIKSLSYGLDEEAIRLLREGPRWEMTDSIKAKEVGGMW